MATWVQSHDGAALLAPGLALPDDHHAVGARVRGDDPLLVLHGGGPHALPALAAQDLPSPSPCAESDNEDRKLPPETASSGSR